MHVGKQYEVNSATSPKNDHLLEDISLFENIDREKLALLSKTAIKKKFKRNQLVMDTLSSGQSLYIIHLGIVKVVNTDKDGHEQILAIHKKGDSFGEIAILDGKTLPAMVVALTDCEVSFLSKEKVEEYILNDVQTLRQVTLSLCSRLRESWLQLEVTHFGDAEQRVRSILNLVAAQHGKWTRDGILITIRLTQYNIAAYAGLTQKTVSQILNKLLRKDEIAVNDKKQIVLKAVYYRDKIN
jgi:CRP/FNR family transcriptional regulator